MVFKRTYRYSGSYFVTLKIISSQKMNLINKSPYSKSQFLRPGLLKPVLHQPTKTIKERKIQLSSDSHFLQQDFQVENTHIKSLRILTLVRKNIPPSNDVSLCVSQYSATLGEFIPLLVQCKPVHPTPHSKPKPSMKQPQGWTEVARKARLCQTTS